MNGELLYLITGYKGKSSSKKPGGKKGHKGHRQAMLDPSLPNAYRSGYGPRPSATVAGGNLRVRQCIQ
jgi:hypothetical protein